MMPAYKILLVEDNPGDIKDLFGNLFYEYLRKSNKSGASHDGQNSSPQLGDLGSTEGITGNVHLPKNPGQIENDLITDLKKVPFLDVAKNIVEALELVRDHAEDYLLFIVDRDLGKITDNIKEEIKTIWKDFNSEKAVKFAGDLLLEYLCLEKGMVKECKERFRFLTANNKEGINALQEFLEALHFPKELSGNKKGDGNTPEPGDMIVAKGDYGEPFKKLRAKVNDPVCFHLMAKHRDVFNALRKNTDDLCVDELEHVKNLIKALAYVEDVRLEGKEKLEPPSIDLLRALLEAFRRSMRKRREEENSPDFKGHKTLTRYFERSFQELKEVNPQNDPQKNDLACWFKPSSYLGYHPNTNPCPACGKIHEKAKRNARKDFCSFEMTNEHYAYINRLIYSITSQEIHHNDRPRIAGCRLQLMVYGICELLLFYQNEIKGETVKPEDKDLLRCRILDLLHFLNKDKNGWMKCEDLKVFSQYLVGCDKVTLNSIGFEVSEDKKRFKLE